MLLLLKDLSPDKFTCMPGVVDRIPINYLARVPEFPKSSLPFFLILKDPNPLP